MPPEETSSASEVPGLTNPSALSLERFPIRTRDSAVTRSGWRLSIDCAEGAGAIVRIEAAPPETVFRGEGVFLGWPRERLEAAYEALRPKSHAPDFEIRQLG